MPYPPRGGGRADVWRRVEAFTKLGHEVMLVHQYELKPPRAPLPEHLDEMDAVLAARFSYPIRRGALRTLYRLAGMRALPWRVAKAQPQGAAALEAVRAFDPDLIWLDGPWLGEFARVVRDELGAPIAYRSHNIEHLYLRRQAEVSPSLSKRVAWRLATVGLEKYEFDLMRESRLVLDISGDDLVFWQERGVERIRALPPLSEVAISGSPSSNVPGEVVFAGGLRLPNNIHGVRWLVNSVLPIVLRSKPDLTLTIVGSDPSPDLRRELEGNAAVRTAFDVPSVNPYLFGAAVLVNPVSIGSGVQLKMLDMLMTDAPIVTTTQGIRGLPPAAVRQFGVADTAEDFAAAILRGIDAPPIDTEKRARIRDNFGIDALARTLAELSQDPTASPAE